jgi:hypothetical protein
MKQYELQAKLFSILQTAPASIRFLVVLVISNLALLFAFTGKTNAQTAHLPLECLKNFESLWNGFEVKCAVAGSTGRDHSAKDYWTQGIAEKDAYAVYTFCQTNSGDYCELNIAHEKDGTAATKIQTSNGRLFEASNHQPSAVNVTRDFKHAIATSSKFVPVGVLLSDGELFTSILKHNSFKFNTAAEELNGIPCEVLRATSDVFGDYTFWLARNPEAHLLRVKVIKNARHLVSPRPGHQKPLSAPRTATPEELEGIAESERDKYSARLAQVPPTIKVEEDYIFSDYSYQHGKFVPGLVKSGQTAWGKDGGFLFVGMAYFITAVDLFEVSDSTKALFRHFQVPNGNPVIVRGEEGLGWAFNDGDITRVIDGASIERTNGIRFRKKDATWHYYLAAGLALAVSCFWLYRSSMQRIN